ncbi:odorant receptor 13a-like [Vespa velutina]|uniref:odorant receptor 13a-like n=1 Tax=Vespa velutina TaxID=202808 RepID=UPI001FB54C07|nr:odorant receptor 13a-like [Vespa velutina]
MDFFDHRHFVLNKTMLRILGQWPYQSFRIKCISYIFLFIFGATQIVAKLCAIITSHDNLNVVLEDLAPLFSNFSSAIKIINIGVQRKKVKTILNRIETDYTFFTTNSEKEIISKYAENGRKFTIYCSAIFFVAMLRFMIVPLKGIFRKVNDTSERPMLHHVEYFVDTQKYYYLIIFQAYVVYFIVCFSFAMTDTLFVVFVQHNCGLFKTLGYRLSHLIDEKVLDDDVLNPSKSKDKYYKDISLYALRHQKAIEFAELLDSFYSKTFFMISGLSMLRISVTGLKAVLNVNNLKQFIQNMFICYTALIHVYFECMNGQRLINHSSEMHQHLINTEWYRTSLRTRKVIALMTLRSLKPSILTAAGLLNISLETFSSIVRTSISYFTVMRSFQ